MDDKFSRQYDYKANSNLVLKTDTSLLDKRPSNETTGEVQSLVGRISGRMGDRVSQSRKKETDEGELKKKSRKKLKLGNNEPSKLKQELHDPHIFSIAEIDTKDLLYQPKSDLTAAVYDLIIKFVRKQLGFQPNSIINVAADEIISTMKNPNFNEEMRRSEVNNLLSEEELSDESYNELCNLCKKINDWQTTGLSSKVREDVAEEESGGIGVIVSDDEDASSDEYLSEVHDSDGEFDLDEIFENEATLERTESKQIQDLDELAMRQVNIVPKIDVPEPIRKEGYQEYHIAAKKRHSHKQVKLRRLDELPNDVSKAFGDIKSLNVIQSEIYQSAMETDKSLLICAPTGAGKTNIALMTMLRVILKYPLDERDRERLKIKSHFDTREFKMIYVAPIKALVQEVVENFRNRLGGYPYYLTVREFTGDQQLTQKEISETQLIVCTPEKWDIVTRKSVDRLYTKLVKLVIFDEIHLLHNERGATLEALVARIKRHRKLEGERIRIVGLSATLPNYRDVSQFITPRDDSEREESTTFYFDSTYRPIPLKQQYIAMTNTKKSLRMINDIVYEKVIERLIDNSQILIFVHSRPDTSKTAEYMKCKALDQQKLNLFMSSESAIEQIREAGENVNTKLRELLQFGIGIHHAGLNKDERKIVEDLFRGKFIKVLVSTATLAWGVNLPARTVIIKGTQVYKDGRWTDLDSLDVTQMLGRAGRPGFDREGEGIVITQQSQVNFYMSLMTEQLPVESKLIPRLAEFINAECVIGNIESKDDAAKWISETYLSCRMASVLKQSDNKQYLTMYGIGPDIKDVSDLKFHEQKLAYIAACTLDERGLIVFDRNSGVIQSTELGRIASHYNCSSRTIKLFNDSIHEHTSDIELLRTFSMADEFSDIYVRKGEELDLQTLINQVPFPIDDKRATPGANKVNVLLQVYMFRMNIESSDLISDMHFIRENAARLARAIHEIVLMKGFAHVAELSFDLCRKIDNRMTVCHSPIRQFLNLNKCHYRCRKDNHDRACVGQYLERFDPEMVNRLEKKNYHIDELRILKAEKLTELLRCEPRQGKKIYNLLKFLPKFKIEASVKPVSKSSLKVDLSIQLDYSISKTELLWLLVEDVNQEVLLHHEMIHVREEYELKPIHTTFYVPYLTPVHPFYYIRMLPDKWFGCDHHLPIYIEKLTLPDESITSSQPLDLEPQTARSLGNPLFERVYEDKFKGASFNQIQTQAFKHLYETDEDIILLAAAGSGKTTCAELAVIRNINMRGTSSKCGYIAANLQAAQVIYDAWMKLFGRHYGVVLLSGNHRLDANRVDNESTNIVIGYPETWHVLSLTRSKKYRKLMSKFHLYILDDIHVLNSDRHSVLEWVCSKIRYLTKLTPRPARIVALGSPMACADSLRSWLAFERGNKEPILLNYLPSIRPVKMELIIQKFHSYDYEMRLLTMKRPVYRHIIYGARQKPSLIFVADFNQAKEVCETLINHSQNDRISFAHPRLKKGDLQEEELNRCLNYGIGYLYYGMDHRDRMLVEKLYDSGQIMILVAAVSICWSLHCRSYMTIIMDTQQYDGSKSRDYELTDIMQMVGLTGRPLYDHECKCIIMCQTSKADYYDRFLREPLTAESELPACLISHVNYEIATGSVLTEFNKIYNPYLAHTFFYKRISINPNYYGIIVPEDSEQKSKVFGSFFNNLVYKVALDLKDTEFLTMEGSHENPEFDPKLLSKISLEYYINFETLSAYTKWLTDNMKSFDSRRHKDRNMSSLMELLSEKTFEFDSIMMRHGELKILKNLYYRLWRENPDQDQLYNTRFKVSSLLWSFYKSDGKEELLDGELHEDRNHIISLSHRLLMAIVDIAWLKDSYNLAETSIRLAKILVPFKRTALPKIDMESAITRDGDQVKVELAVTRETDPFSLDEFNRNHGSRLPITMYRDEGWCFLIRGHSSKKDDDDKFLLFKRVKTPAKGKNEYKLDFMITDISDDYSYELLFMSDFYQTKEDRKIQFSINA